MSVEVVPPAVLEAARDGDRSAFDEMVRLTYADMYTLAYRLTGDPEDARDVVQDAYLRAYRALDRFRGDARFGTWMYRITANCASTHLGRRRRHRHDELTDESPIADPRPETDPELRATASVLRQEVDEALDRLPARLRAVVVLRDVYDLSHDEIARSLGITETAAKVRLHRARKKLREAVLEPASDRASSVEADTVEVRRAVLEPASDRASSAEADTVEVRRAV